MFLKILILKSLTLEKSLFQNKLVFTILGLTIGVFLILRIAKFLSTIKFSKTSDTRRYNA